MSSPSPDRPSIVVVGSANTDMVITAPRIPSPGETILGTSFVMAPGGKGANQAVAAARLGAAVTFVARVGTDLFGSEAIAGYQRDGIDTAFIVRDPDAPSGIAMIVVDAHGENAIVVASGANMRLTPADVDRAEHAIAEADLLILQLEVPDETVRHAVELATAHRIPVILNPAPAHPLDDALLQQVEYLTPNETEARILTGIDVVDDASADRAARTLLGRGVRTVVLTLGARGAWLATDGGGRLIPTARVQAVDTTAAGDAFNGGLAVALAVRHTLDEAVRFANHVGALAVTKLGAQPSMPTRDEVDAFMGD
ncbi:MAG: ribokinase [Candidatus Latescibacteria bacterium]|nr:ribokinase [Candidatus Latescibacterota bacterium]